MTPYLLPYRTGGPRHREAVPAGEPALFALPVANTDCGLRADAFLLAARDAIGTSPALVHRFPPCVGPSRRAPQD